MSTCCECTPTYTWSFGSDKTSLRRTSTPIPGDESCFSESFSSTTDKLLYHSWMDGLFHGSTHRKTCTSCEGDSLDRLWDDDTPTSLNTGSGLPLADIAGSGPAIASTKSADVLAPILPAAPGGPFPVDGAFTAGYAAGPGAAVFGNVPGNELTGADYANCPPPGMNLVPGFRPIGANVVPVPGHPSTGMNFLPIPAPATFVPVPVRANYAIAPGPMDFAFPVGVIVANGPGPVPAGANLVVGAAPFAVNLASHYDPYSAVPGNLGPYQVLVPAFHTQSCNTTLYCNFFLGCNPNGTCCPQPKPPLNGYQ